MHDATRSGLAAWESFYVIVGSSAAALTGLQFVVVALLAENRIRSTTREIDAFATPTGRGSFGSTRCSDNSPPARSLPDNPSPGHRRSGQSSANQPLAGRLHNPDSGSK
jgi:hypothetical protein